LPEFAESVEEVHTSASFIAERFGGWHRGCTACRQKTRCECAEDEQRGGGKQSGCGEDAVHPAGKDDAKEAVECEADRDADGGDE